MKRAVPPRIALFATEAVPVVVAILRVRSKWWHVVRIDKKGGVERGSWFYGTKILVDQCSLNHDGSLLAYFATAKGLPGWSGLSRPPWLHCVAQIKEKTTLLSSCAFGFPRAGEVCIPPRSNPSPLSLGKTQQIYEHIRQVMGPSQSDLEQAESDIRNILHLRVRHHDYGPDRMTRQGFVPVGESWSWTGRDGVCRVVPVKGFTDNDLGSLHTLNCCVDALGRWWQALDGIITCHEIHKKTQRIVCSIDTNSWVPPQRNANKKAKS